MNKKLSLLIAVVLFSLPSFGQKVPGWKGVVSTCKQAFCKKAPFNRARILEAKQINATLKKRVQQSKRKVYANTALNNLPKWAFLSEFPIQRFQDWPNELSAQLYQEQPWLQEASLQAQQNYFIALQNRLLKTVVAQRKQLQADLARNAQRLAAKQEFFWPTPTAGQAASSVGKKVKYVFVGEEHAKPLVQKEISSFIRALQEENPDRQIVYLTEFLPKDRSIFKFINKLREHKTPALEGYYQLFKDVLLAEVPMYGLEAISVMEKAPVSIHEVPFAAAQRVSNMWGSLVGVYLRNKAWLKTIEAYRKQYPQALFVIHAGMGHTDYNAPFSLARHFAPEETFVLFVAQNIPNFVDRWCPGILDGRKMTGWKDKDLARLAGFDVQIIVK